MSCLYLSHGDLLMKILQISSLAIGYLEFTEPPQIADEDVQLVAITGSISKNPKRSLHYVEQVAEAFPKLPVVFNHGPLEFAYNISPKHINATTHFRYNIAEIAPPNVYYPDSPKIVNGINILSIYGWPYLSSLEYEKTLLRSSVTSAEFTQLWVDDFFCTPNYPQPLTFREFFSHLEKEREELDKLAQLSGPKLIISATPQRRSKWFNGDFRPISMPDGAAVVYATDEPFIGIIEVDT